MMSLGSNCILFGRGLSRPQSWLPQVLSSPQLSVLGLLVPPSPNTAVLSPAVASHEPRIEEAICHVLDIICPLMARKQVGHQEVLGGGRLRIRQPLEVQLSRTWRRLGGISGGNSQHPAISLPGRKPGGLLGSEGLNLLLGGHSSPQDRACLEWESLRAPFVQGGGRPSASWAAGVASCGVPL